MVSSRKLTLKQAPPCLMCLGKCPIYASFDNISLLLVGSKSIFRNDTSIIPFKTSEKVPSFRDIRGWMLQILRLKAAPVAHRRLERTNETKRTMEERKKEHENA